MFLKFPPPGSRLGPVPVSEDSLTIYEDDKVKVMLDAFPNSIGHTLIVPKEHFKDLDDITLETLNHIFTIAKKIKPILEEKLNPESIVLIQKVIGMEV